MGNSDVSDRAQKRAAQFLAPYLAGLMCKRLSRTYLALYRLEFERTGAADANRVGDRFLSPECRLLHGYVKECIVESIRTGIQTSFYTCDYTTKPSMTCGPMLKHLTHGMKNLEEKMQACIPAAGRARRSRLDGRAAGGPTPLVPPLDFSEPRSHARLLSHVSPAHDRPRSATDAHLLAHHDEASTLGRV